MGALLNTMELHHGSRMAVLYLDDDLLAECARDDGRHRGTRESSARARRKSSAVALFKRQADGAYRVSLRSKGDVDVRAVAVRWHGGGHKNAAGCTLTGDYATLKGQMVDAVGEAIGRVAVE